MSNSKLLFECKSVHNGEDLLVTATGFNPTSEPNSKTGQMIQVNIMPKNTKPSESVKNGKDEAVCGDCKHRPSLAKGTKTPACYVVVWMAVNGIWNAYHRGNVPQLIDLAELDEHKVRLGAWGDVGALPPKYAKVLTTLVQRTDKVSTAYTHQWTKREDLKSTHMASAENVAEVREAQAKGWRTYRIIEDPKEMLSTETVCPEGIKGSSVQCKDCGLCNGSKGKDDKRKSIVILPVKSGKKFVKTASGYIAEKVTSKKVNPVKKAKLTLEQLIG